MIKQICFWIVLVHLVIFLFAGLAVLIGETTIRITNPFLAIYVGILMAVIFSIPLTYVAEYFSKKY
jgi:hypothetical protein